MSANARGYIFVLAKQDTRIGFKEQLTTECDPSAPMTYFAFILRPPSTSTLNFHSSPSKADIPLTLTGLKIFTPFSSRIFVKTPSVSHWEMSNSYGWLVFLVRV